MADKLLTGLNDRGYEVAFVEWQAARAARLHRGRKWRHVLAVRARAARVLAPFPRVGRRRRRGDRHPVLLAALATRPGHLPRAPHPHRPVAALLPETGRVARSLARVGADAPRVPPLPVHRRLRVHQAVTRRARHRPGAHPHHRVGHRRRRREHAGAALGRAAVPLPGSPGSPQARRARARHVGEGAPRDRRQAGDRRRGARARAARAARRPGCRVHRLRQRGGAPGLARPRGSSCTRRCTKAGA